MRAAPRLGDVALQLGCLEQAIIPKRWSAPRVHWALAREIREPRTEALIALASTHVRMGRLDLALDHSQQALQLTVDLHARYLQTRALLGLAATRHKLRQHARAVEDARQALHPEVISGTMFGMPCAKAAGKAFMGSFDGGAVFKLNEPARTQALELPGSALFNPSGNRPMREWVVVRPEHQDHWTALAEAALDKVRAV